MVTLPFFTLGSNGKLNGTNKLRRCKLVPESSNGNIKRYNILLVFDIAPNTRADFEEQDLMETPVFASNYDRSKDFALCNNEFSLVDFCSKVPYNCDWVDEYILKLFHDVKSVDELNIKKPKLNYLAQFIFVIKYIQQLNLLPIITLFSDKNVAFGDVDLLLIWVLRTCVVLFIIMIYKSRALATYLSNLLKKINLQSTFDMRLVFRDAILVKH